jgi:type IV pilus assembly protein PilW
MMRSKTIIGRSTGFTMTELLVTMAIFIIIVAAVYGLYKSHQDSYIVQDEVVAMQQSIRAALDLMARDIRMAGYDPSDSGSFGISDIRLKDINGNLDTAGYGTLSVRVDLDENGAVDTGETMSYAMFDFADSSADVLLDLGRDDGGGQQPVAENIDAIGFAFAFDSNGDDLLDTTGGGNIIWAMDTDNDNQLDVSLDTDDDGDIDTGDNPAGTAITPVDTDRIRAVRVWILARTGRDDNSYGDSSTYVVANKRITPNDNYRRRLLETNILCRNMGL